jgi:hypothetical protein
MLPIHMIAVTIAHLFRAIIELKVGRFRCQEKNTVVILLAIPLNALLAVPIADTFAIHYSCR